MVRFSLVKTEIDYILKYILDSIHLSYLTYTSHIIIQSRSQSIPSYTHNRNHSLNLYYFIPHNRHDIMSFMPPMMASALRADEELLYRIRAFLYDLRNMAHDRASERRIHSTKDELYLGAPYFTPAEVAHIKTAIVNQAYRPGCDQLPTVVEFVRLCLAGFFNTHKPSGYVQPYDLAPIYERAFGISVYELQDAQFLFRLRRQGLRRTQYYLRQQ